jgi:hypothetical protein
MAKKIDLKGKTIFDFCDDKDLIGRITQAEDDCITQEEMLEFPVSVHISYIIDYAYNSKNNALYNAARKAYKAARAEENRIAMDGVERDIIIDF